MDQAAIFRKISLDRQASPEQLDQLLQVTDAKGWTALAALGTLLATALVWGIFGRVPETISGAGILVKSGGIYEVVPTSGGRVVDVAVSVGDLVTEGQVVARIAQEDVSERLQQARAALGHLEAERDRATAFGARDSVVQEAYLAQQRQRLAQSIEASEQSARWLLERIRNEEQLVAQGLATKSALLATRQQYDAARERIADARSQLTQLQARRLELANQRQAERQAGLARIRERELAVRDLERQLRTSTEVIAPQTGRILEVMAERGSVVAPGEPVLTLDLTGRAVKELEAVIYVPSVHGKRIRPGMLVQIAPSTVKQEEYGLMLAKVTYVSDFPATSRGMRRVLKNETLMQTLSGGDAPYELHADLVVDPATASRYRWTSSGGPPVRIQSGTLAIGHVEVASRRPIEMVIPLVRKHMGI